MKLVGIYYILLYFISLFGIKRKQKYVPTLHFIIKFYILKLLHYETISCIGNTDMCNEDRQRWTKNIVLFIFTQKLHSRYEIISDT